MSSVNRLTIDRTVDLWRRLGRRTFYYHEVEDLLVNPSQLYAIWSSGLDATDSESPDFSRGECQ